MNVPKNHLGNLLKGWSLGHIHLKDFLLLAKMGPLKLAHKVILNIVGR